MMFITPSKRRQAVGLLVCAALCLGVAAKAGGGQDKDAKDDILLFKGSWDVTKLTKDGNDVPEEFFKDIKLTFSGNSVTFTIQDMQKKATITIDSTKKPKHIDLKIEDAPDSAYGIFEFNGDTVKIHAAEDKDQRPKDFKSDAQFMIVLKRAAADKGEKSDKKGGRERNAATTALRAGQGKAEKHQLQGKWVITAGTKDGKDLPANLVGKITATFDGDKVMFQAEEAPPKTGTFKLDDKAKPRQIDIIVEGETMHSIYEVEGDTLRFCHTEPGGARPTEFKAEAGSPNATMVFKREKTEKTEKKAGGRQPTPALTAFRGVQEKKAAKSDTDLIQGTWLVESAMDDGLELADEIRDMIKFHVAGDKLEIKFGEVAMKGSYKVDETKKPKTVDITLESGEGMIGIYETMGNKVKFCMALNDKGTQRPKEFTSPAGSGYKLVVLKRAPEEKKNDAKPKGRGLEVEVGFAEDQGDKADKEQDLFQGTWQVIAFTEGGNKKDDNETAKLKLVVKSDAITLEDMGDAKHATFKMDSTKKPKQIDIIPEGGAEKIEGIYELTGDTLKICAKKGGPRPTEFKSEAGSETVLMELKRIVAKKVEIKALPAKNSDLDRITGVWKLLKARGDGEDALTDFVAPVRLTFDTDGTVNVQGTPKGDKGTFKIDAEANPKQITLVTGEKNEAVPGIYQFDGDKLVLCFTEIAAGKERPKEFTAAKGTKQIVFVLEQTQTGEQMARARTDAVESAGRSRSANNLKQIGMAMHLHHDNHGTFPAHAIYSKDGQMPLLSWRVAILPFIEEQALYNQFKLDEPWDSEHNKKLIAKMPKTYEPVGLGAKGEGLTYYQVFTGKDSVFDGPNKAKMPGSFKDGTSNTVLAVEAKEPVIWTKPDDLVLPKMGDKMPELGGMFTNGMNLLFCDASVQWVRTDIDPVTLRAIITPSGGEVVDRNKLDQPAAAMKKDAK